MEQERVVELLRRSDLFSGLDQVTLKKIAAFTSEKEFQSDQLIVEEGDSTGQVYVIAEGRMAVEIEAPADAGQPHQTLTVDVLNVGRSLGWSTLIGHPKYSATARCITPTQVLVIDGRSLVNLLNEDCTIGFQVMSRTARIIAERLRDTRGQLISHIGMCFIYDQHRTY